MSDQAPNKFYLNGTFTHVQIGLENNTGITNQNESMQDEQQSVRYELNDLNERVGDIETELDAQQRNLKDRVEDLETELDRVKKKNTELENVEACSRVEIGNLRKVVKKLENDAADSRSKIDHLTNVVKTLKETSNETKEMAVSKREGPILKKKRGLENVAPCSRDEKETKKFLRFSRKILTLSLCDIRYKELVNDAESSGDVIDNERLWEMAVKETKKMGMSGYSKLDFLKAKVEFLKLLTAELLKEDNLTPTE